MNLSILVNHGCIYNCEFCISSSQLSKNDYKFKLKDLRDIRKLLLSKKYTRLSISGGGDPLYIHNEEIMFFYKLINNLCLKLNIHLSIHTNFQKPTVKSKIFDNFVVSIHKEDYKMKFHYWTDNSTNDGYNLRFAYVIGYNDNDLELINDMIKYLPKNSKLTFKQLDSKNISEIKDYDKIMSLLSNKIKFLKRGDYNVYYNLKDNKIYDVFKDIKWN